MPPTPTRPPLDSDRPARPRTGERARAGRRQAVRRQRLLAFGLLALVTAGIAVSVVLASGKSARGRGGAGTSQGTRTASATTAPSAKAPGPPFAVGLRVMRLTDASRTITLPDGTSAPRTLVTEVRYPALGPPGASDSTNAAPARGAGPFPLIVFGHGFAVTPSLYARLLRSWARAGYVVAAPLFPLENAHAPGGPNESDLVNQPADVTFVISRMLAAGGAGSGPLTGLIDPAQIAVAGQSDGGDTALAVAYDSRYRDRRVGAAVILSGAEIPAVGGFTFPRAAPPLLATQGTADTINPPGLTETFFQAAPPPKYLLSLLGAEHLPPYSSARPQLAIVERVTTAFLDGYLKGRPASLSRLVALGSVPGTATLTAYP